MSVENLLIILPIISLGVNVVAQILLRRLFNQIAWSIIGGFLIGLLCDVSVGDLVSLMTYLALSFCFWAFLNLNITSLRIRLIRELLHEPNGLSNDVVLERYSPVELIKRRIIRLEQSGQIKIYQQKWIVHSRALLIFVWVSAFLKWLIVNKKEHASD